MRRRARTGLAWAPALTGVLLTLTLGAPVRGEDAPRFQPVDVFLEVPEGIRVGAWQIEVRPVGGEAKLVGVEGGEAPDFTNPPYYDPRALADGERIVLAAFTRGRPLGPGRHRVATLHTLGTAVRWEATLVAAGDEAGRRIELRVWAKAREEAR